MQGMIQGSGKENEIKDSNKVMNSMGQINIPVPG
jgi:hypothetical protein